MQGPVPSIYSALSMGSLSLCDCQGLTPFTSGTLGYQIMSLSSGEGIGNPLQYSCLENHTDKGAWRDTVYEDYKNSETTSRLTLTN